MTHNEYRRADYAKNKIDALHTKYPEVKDGSDQRGGSKSQG